MNKLIYLNEKSKGKVVEICDLKIGLPKKPKVGTLGTKKSKKKQIGTVGDKKKEAPTGDPVGTVGDSDDIFDEPELIGTYPKKKKSKKKKKKSTETSRIKRRAY